MTQTYWDHLVNHVGKIGARQEQGSLCSNLVEMNSAGEGETPNKHNCSPSILCKRGAFSDEQLSQASIQRTMSKILFGF